MLLPVPVPGVLKIASDFSEAFLSSRFPWIAKYVIVENELLEPCDLLTITYDSSRSARRSRFRVRAAGR